MTEQELEIKVRTLEDQVKTMGDQINALQTLLDIEAIKTLQRVYGFYLEHWMFQEIVDCFADSPDVYLDFYPLGIWKGKQGVIKYFEQHKQYNPQFLHQIMQLSPVIHVAPDGQSAKGRWYGYGPIADPRGGLGDELLHSGTYEMEYVKEDGIWKFEMLSWRVNYIATPEKGFVKFDREAVFGKNFKFSGNKPDVTFTKSQNTSYPSGYIYPFHFKHPVTGKKTSEEDINAGLGFTSGE
ncbi:MAG: nuclear transport factor 2 family protein [Dehalococcoidales bacterium]|nr:nuclear transport factor 2 family protein [Dehalococcoidales bacterium]